MNGVQGARQIGRIRPERGRWETFTDWARAQGEIILRPLVGVLARWNVHPNTVTILGFLLQAGIGVVFGLGRLRLGGILLLAIAPVDALDGALARAVGRKSRFGAFLDSTLDRLSDAALILGLTAHFIREGDHTLVALLLIALVASLLVSYVRARAEAAHPHRSAADTPSRSTITQPEPPHRWHAVSAMSPHYALLARPLPAGPAPRAIV